MDKKYCLILLLAVMFVFLGSQNQKEIFACDFAPCLEAVGEEPIVVGKDTYDFEYRLLCQYPTDVAIQIDNSIECIPDGKGGCANITVSLDRNPKKRLKSFVKNKLCEGSAIELKKGPRPSYFLVVNIGSEEIGNDGASDRSRCFKYLSIYIVSNKKLSWGPGNIVIKKDICGVCPTSLVPVVESEISTSEQYIQLGPCKVKVNFDSNNNPLPFGQNSVRCPSGVTPPTVSGIYLNQQIELITHGQGDMNEEETELSLYPETGVNEGSISSVNVPVLGQVPVAFKTGNDSTYWTYIPGYGWILVRY